MPSLSPYKVVLSLSLIASLASAVPTPGPSAIELPFRWTRRLHRRAQVEVDATYTVLEPMVEVGVGTPPQPFNMVFDTGSSDTWVPSKSCDANRGCVTAHKFDRSKSSTAGSLDMPFIATYGSGSMNGTYFKDTVTFGGNARLKDQTMAIVNSTVGTFATQDPKEDTVMDGILGAGYPGLMLARLQFNDTSALPVPISLYENKVISKPLFSVYTGPVGSTSGSIIFGGVQSVAGDLHTAPVLRSRVFNGDDSQYYQWRIHIDNISVGLGSNGIDQILDAGKNKPTLEYSNPMHTFHVDTGTPVSRLPAKEVEYLAVSLFGSGRFTRTNDGRYLVNRCSSFKNDASAPILSITVPDMSSKLFTLHLEADDLLLMNDPNADVCLFTFGVGQDYMIGNMIMSKYVTVFNFGEKTISFASVKGDTA